MQGQRNVGGDGALQGGASAREACLSKGAPGRLLNAEQYGSEGGGSILNMRVCKYSDTGGSCDPIPIPNR